MCSNCTEEGARKLIGKASVLERRAAVERGEQENKGVAKGTDRFANGQAHALFRALNVEDSGLLRQVLAARQARWSGAARRYRGGCWWGVMKRLVVLCRRSSCRACRGGRRGTSRRLQKVRVSSAFV